MQKKLTFFPVTSNEFYLNDNFEQHIRKSRKNGGFYPREVTMVSSRILLRLGGGGGLILYFFEKQSNIEHFFSSMRRN
jgi:hypothetical protein